MSDFDRALDARFQAERDRAANILRGACEWVVARNVTLDIALDAAARHTQYGDEFGTLWASCGRCSRAQCGHLFQSELPFGALTVDCHGCGEKVGWTP